MELHECGIKSGVNSVEFVGHFRQAALHRPSFGTKNAAVFGRDPCKVNMDHAMRFVAVLVAVRFPLNPLPQFLPAHLRPLKVFSSYLAGHRRGFREAWMTARTDVTPPFDAKNTPYGK